MFNRIPKIAPRGVYHLPWYGPNGEVYVVAVGANGHKVSEVTVTVDDDVRAAEQRMRVHLAADARRPRLQVVR